MGAHYCHSIALHARFSGMQDEITTTNNNANMPRLSRMVKRHENYSGVFFVA
jgi:hypothetical protein